ncbi:unnamed protein product [Acanthocheilonema viteae]|uniref:Uncharacterized protein n=1 Tax=Acanthocheilonema viteae TaxID=6277 RepID=A0A498SMY5_ACAVI|nr:unnamed protein product [Acanthocheilonema viteae]
MNRNLLNLTRAFTRHYCLKPPGRKNWPRPMMLGPQTSMHPKFPGWCLYYLPVSDNKYLWSIIIFLFHFTGFAVPTLGEPVKLRLVFSILD